MPSVTIGLSARQVDRANVVIDWNAALLRAIWNDATSPTAASRDEAILGVAVFDAVNGIVPQYAGFRVPGLHGRAPRHASPAAAAVAAADTVLNSLFPDQRALFDAELQATLPIVANGPREAAGIGWGQTVADAVLAWRAGDGANAPTTYQPAPPGGTPGVYELTPAAGLGAKPPGFLPALAPQWGQVTPWLMKGPARYVPPPPPPITSPEYAVAFNQVKSLGASNSTTRTFDETQYAHFWADPSGLSVTPPGHWDEIAEHLALQKHLNLAQTAHLFGLLNAGLADAAIVCWDTKYIYNYWRPVTAIRDPRMSQINPATTPDPTWTPLWNTPNFPSYDSGHSSFSGTASVILASLLGRNTHFTIGSDDMPGYSRSFRSFAQAANEAGESRVVGGIHYFFDNEAALASGRALGRFASHQLRALPG
jgi:hypothetical protein